MKKFPTVCPCCFTYPLDNPPIAKEIRKYFKKQSLFFYLLKSKLTKWRIRAKLAVREHKKKIVLGLFAKNSHEIISTDFCRAHHSLIQEAAHILKEEMHKSSISPYNEDLSTGTLRYIQLTTDKKEIQLVLVINHENINKEVLQLLRRLKKHVLFSSVWINFNTQKNNVIFSNVWKKAYGKEFLFQEILGKSFAYHPGCFSQPHLEIFEKMICFIERKIPKHCCVIELYAGVGAIGLSLMQKCKNLTLVENNSYAKISFLKTLEKSFLKYKKRIQYKCIDSGKIKDFQKFDVIILDPPRKGISAKLMGSLVNLSNKKIIYVSCCFETFRRDVEILKKHDWKLVDGKGFLMFPGSNHVEIVGILEKKSG